MVGDDNYTRVYPVTDKQCQQLITSFTRHGSLSNPSGEATAATFAAMPAILHAK